MFCKNIITHFLLFSLLILCSFPLFSEHHFTLGKQEFEPGDKPETILTIQKRGWYSIRVKGLIPALLGIIDRMSGSLDSVTKAEGEEGRMDILLDQGEYKLKLKTDTDMEGDLSLSVVEYTEKNITAGSQSLPLIHDLDFYEKTLHDLETRSYWIQAGENEEIILEIAGRCLSSVSLWRDGYWKESVYFQQRRIEPGTGKPLYYYSLNTKLPEGTYLLQCVGGKKAEWPGDEEKNPLYIRRGYSYLGAENYTDLTISPFGKDTFRTGGQSTFFQLIQDDLTPVTLTVDSRNAYITKDSRNPWCSLTRYEKEDDHILSITGNPGSSVRLLFFNRKSGMHIPYDDRGKTYFFSGFRTIEGKNSIDLTPFYTIYRDYDKYEIPYQDLIRLAKGNVYYRKINLLAQANAAFAVETKGTYRIREFGTGAEAEYRFVLMDDPDSRSYAEYKKTGGSVELINGYYLLEIRPLHAGILHFVIYHRDDENKITALEKTRPPEPGNHFLWPEVKVKDGGERHYINLNEEPGIYSTIMKRDLPLSFSSPLPLYLTGGETVSLSFYNETESLLSVQGKDFTVKVDGKEKENNTRLTKGHYTMTLVNSGSTGNYFSIHTKKIVQQPPDPRLDITDPRDVYRILTAEQPVFTDFNRREVKQYLLVVLKPALYRIETSGRLATKITVRSPLKTELFSVQQNGIGRNALVQTYLKEGNYLVEVETLGQSMGRCGIHLNTTIVTDGGTIRDKSISRTTVLKDHAIKYDVEIRDTGNYMIETIGFQSSIPCRFEEDGGWPMVMNTTGRYNGYLDEGMYHYYSLPLDFRTRRITTIVSEDPVKEDEQEVILNRQKSGRWKERPGRPPDVYSLTLPAGMTVTLVLSSGMQGKMIHQKSGAQINFSYKDSSTVECEAGEYKIEIMSIEEDNDVFYTFTCKTDQLAPGLWKRVTRFPADIEIRTGSEDILRIWSYGKTDTNASLWNTDGTILLAENDDMEHDWNFEILQKLAAGSYLLRIEAQGKSSSGESSVFLDKIEQQDLAGTPKSLPFKEEVTIRENTILKIPFYSGSKSRLITIDCGAAASVTGTLYQDKKMCAVFHNKLFISLKPDKEYELFLSHKLQKDIPVFLVIEPAVFTEYELKGKKHISLENAVRLINRDGVSFIVSGDREGLLFSPGDEIPARQVNLFPYNSVKHEAWLINTDNSKTKEIDIEPVVITQPTVLSFPFDRTEHSFTLSYYDNKLLLLEARLPGKKVGLSVVHQKDYTPGVYHWEGIGLKKDTTLFGVAEKGEFRGKLWIAEDFHVKGTPLSCALSVTSFVLQNKETLPFSEEMTVLLEPGKGYTLLLQEANQLVQLLLSKGLVAFHWQNKKPQQLFNAALVNQQHLLPVRGGSISIVNTSGKNRLFRIKTSRDSSARGIQPEVKEKDIYEKVFEHPGTEHIIVKTRTHNRILCAAGNVSPPVLKADDGMLYYGEIDPDYPGLFFLPARNGILEVSHGPGSVFVWQADISQPFAPLVKKAHTLSPEVLKNSASIEKKSRLFAVKVDAPGFLHVSSDLPGTMALLKNRNILTVRLSSERTGNTLFYNVTPGSYSLYINPLNEEMKRGKLICSVLVPEKLSENGQGKSFFIGPGEYQAFVFTVEKEGLVGIGIRGESDSLSGILYDPSFNRIEQGPLIFHTLVPGDYYFLVFSRGAAVQYSPVLFGTRGSRTDIPYDVLKQYQK